MFNAQPPHPGDSFDTVGGWQWASQITQAVRDLGSPAAPSASLLGLNNVWTGMNAFQAAVSISALLTLLAGITSSGPNVFNGTSKFNGISSFAAAVELNGTIPITFDGPTARNKIFYNIFALDLELWTNNIQTLTLDSFGNVAVNNGNLSIGNGAQFNVGAGAYIQHTGSGPTGLIGFYGPLGFTGGFRDGGELVTVGISASSASSGAASALPATPATYMEFTFNGFDYKLPCYNV